jgi:hypothetical protein
MRKNKNKKTSKDLDSLVLTEEEIVLRREDLDTLMRVGERKKEE